MQPTARRDELDIALEGWREQAGDDTTEGVSVVEGELGRTIGINTTIVAKAENHPAAAMIGERGDMACKLCLRDTVAQIEPSLQLDLKCFARKIDEVREICRTLAAPLICFNRAHVASSPDRFTSTTSCNGGGMVSWIPADADSNGKRCESWREQMTAHGITNAISYRQVVGREAVATRTFIVRLGRI